MTETQVIENSGERTRVGFPEAPPEKPKSSKGLIIVIVLLLLLLGFGGWFMFGRQRIGLNTEEVTPTPTTFEATSTPTPTEVQAEVVRTDVKVQVLNGTGIVGAASELQKELEEMGYSGIKVGNASPQNATKTNVVFDTKVDDAVKKEIVKLLEGMYQDVTESERTLSDYDVIITTGNPIGGRPATPTPTKGSALTPTKAATTTTVTPTKTPTPTP